MIISPNPRAFETQHFESYVSDPDAVQLSFARASCLLEPVASFVWARDGCCANTLEVYKSVLRTYACTMQLQIRTKV